MTLPRALFPVLLLLLPSCALPGGSLPLHLPAPPEAGIPLAEKAAILEEALGELHLLPWGTLSYRVHLPDGPDGPPVHAYQSDVGAWTGALLGAECERWAATGEPEALDRVRGLLRGLTLLTAVTGQRGLYARHAAPAGFLRRERRPERWNDGAPGWEGWRWREDVSRDQAAGLVHGYAAVLDLVVDPWCRARAGRLAGDLADRVFGRGLSWEDHDGEESTYGDLRPRIAGLPVGVNAAIVLGLADAAHRGTGEARHRRRLESLVEGGACEALRYPTLRILGKEGWSNANMAAMALASFLREGSPAGDPVRDRVRRAAADSLRRILDLHRGEGNAYWIAIAAAVGNGAGATERDLADARAQLRRYSPDRRSFRLEHSALDLPRASLGSKKGQEQFTVPLPVDMQGASSFCWKSNPYEVLQEAEGDGRTVLAGVDFLAAYWPLRRLGLLGRE
jgi:hypothetical protein